MGNKPGIFTVLKPTTNRYSSTIKVFVSTSGEYRQIQSPTKVAELMLDIPNHFVADSRSLQVNRHFLPLSADRNLEMGGMYVMFPMKRLNSVFTSTDLTMVFGRGGGVVRRSTIGGSRISPELAEVSGEESHELPKLSLEGLDDSFVGQMKRLSHCRSRRTSLETIQEEISCTN